MGTYKLRPAEQYLLDQTKHGDSVGFAGRADKKIRAPVLRHIVLGLPVTEDDRRVWWPLTSLFSEPEEGRLCPVTGAGIAISDAIIEGRLELDAAIGREGGPICPLEFKRCHFELGANEPGAEKTSGFSGANAHFARLGFRECEFADPPRPKPAQEYQAAPEAATPTIRLSGARIEGDLDMRDIHPQGATDLLWIRATGIYVDGEVDLSNCHLRAPTERRPRRMCEEAEDALNLTLAEIRGDLQFLNGSRCEGRIKLRAAHIAGDVWMSGARLEPIVDDEEAIFLQGTRIDGFLMMDGRWERTREQGRFLEFVCAGGMTLTSTEIGRGFHLDDAQVEGPVQASGLVVGEDVSIAAEISNDVDLSGCRIGGSLDISGLSLAASVKRFCLTNGTIGRSLKLVSSEGDYELIGARSLALQSPRHLDLVETLWRHRSPATKAAGSGKPRPAGDDAQFDDRVPLDQHLVQATFLRRGSSIVHLDGHADVPRRVAGWFRGGLGKKSRAALAALLDTYSPGPRRPAKAAAVADRPGETQAVPPASSPPSADPEYRFQGGLILPRRRPKREMKAFVGQWDWITRCEPSMQVEKIGPGIEALRSYVHPKALLQGEIDLENLSCDLLDDQAGSGWGTHAGPISMNHFTYNRTTWERPNPRQRWGLSTRPRKGLIARLRKLWKVVSKDPVRRSAGGIAGLGRRAWGKVATWFKRSAAEHLPVAIAWLFNLSGRLRVGEHWTPVESKRNWIYRQFHTEGLSSSSKYRIHPSEYRSQPFEQVIKVARTEGREDYARSFEILKEKIEWSFFVARQWLPFALLGLLVAGLWWWLDSEATVGRLVMVVIGFALLPTLANQVMYRGFGYLRRPAQAIGTLIVAFLIGWLGVAVANNHGMLVIDVTPIGSVVDEQRPGAGPQLGPPLRPGESEARLEYPRIASQRVDPSQALPDAHCGRTINEALYALDVLIPLIDLREESRCEVGRAYGVTADYWFEHIFFDGAETFWKVMKALYAIAGWFIVSLAILTFAHVSRPRGET